MKQGKLAAIGIGIVVLAVVLFSSVYTVRETEQALILQFGNPVRVVREPGIKFKLPFIQNVEYYEKRILDLDPPVQEVLLVDQKRINVDAFARYRIIDPLRFRQRAVTDSNFRQIFGGRLNSAVRGEVAQADLGDMLSEMRAVIMTRIAETLRKQAPDFGVEVVDLRIGRTDLPEATSQAVYNRMRSDRIAQAAQLRAEGEELKAKIEAEADRDRTVILADAGRQGEILRGEGEATRTRMLSEAYGKDPAFFDFFRSLEAYSALGDSGTTFVLTPDSDFFRFFLNERGTVSPEVPAGEGENQANATP
jgi:membrane protease subunit HflC